MRDARPDVSTSAARRAGVLTAAVVVALAAVSGCRGTAHSPDDTIVVLLDVPVKTVDPRYALTNMESRMSRLVASGLTAVDTVSMEPRLELAEAIEAVSPTEMLVRLRADARFANGDAVTAADVAWTFGTVIREGSDSPSHKQLKDRFTAVEVVDARTVRFRLSKPLATFASDLDYGILCAACSSADGKFPPAGLVGAGPYAITSLSSTRIELRANPHYHGGAPPVPRLRFDVVREATARALMLVRGTADLMQNGVRPDVLDDLSSRPRVTVTSGPSVLLTYLMMNNDDPVLAKPEVRQAIAHAIDRPAIIAAKFAGRAELATGLLAPGHWAYEPNVTRYAYDPARAQALLDAAGFPDPDGPGGRPRLRLTYKTSADAFRVSVARIIASQLGEVGIEVTVRSFEFATFFTDVKRGNYQLASMQTTEITEPDFYFPYFNSSRIPTVKTPDDSNRWRYRNAQVDADTEAGRRELEPTARRAIYGRVQQQVAADVPIVPLWHEHNIALMSRRLAGFAVVPNARLGGLARTTKAPTPSP